MTYFLILFIFKTILDVKADNTWQKLNPHLISSFQIKENRLIIKNLNENDLENFECISEHGYLTLHKQLRLDKIEFANFNPKHTMNYQYQIMNAKNNFKTYKNLFEINTIHLSDLSIYSVYSHESNNLKLKCETSSGKYFMSFLDFYSFD